MFDSNGSNTTAAAAVANIVNTCDVSEKSSYFGGTGPVGQRVAALLSLEKADVFITSRA